MPCPHFLFCSALPGNGNRWSRRGRHRQSLQPRLARNCQHSQPLQFPTAFLSIAGSCLLLHGFIRPTESAMPTWTGSDSPRFQVGIFPHLTMCRKLSPPLRHTGDAATARTRSRYCAYVGSHREQQVMAPREEGGTGELPSCAACLKSSAAPGAPTAKVSTASPRCVRGEGAGDWLATCNHLLPPGVDFCSVHGGSCAYKPPPPSSRQASRQANCAGFRTGVASPC